MNLLQAIHERWADDAALCQLLPADRVYTGLSANPTFPYAVISRRSQKPLVLSGDGATIDRVGLRVEVFHDRYDTASAIVDRLKTSLHLADLPLAGSDRVLGVVRTNDYEQQLDDGSWRFVVEFTCTVYLDAGV